MGFASRQFIDGSDREGEEKPSKLFKTIGLKQLPDARGIFIRGLSLRRNDGNEDPFNQELGRQRKVGEYQNDSIKKHEHLYEHAFHDGRGKSGHSNPGVFASHKTVKTEPNIDAGLETRPKNISLFIYIKIN